eukprot:763910-Pleurochrysis_carterae.AAC.2
MNVTSSRQKTNHAIFSARRALFFPVCRLMIDSNYGYAARRTKCTIVNTVASEPHDQRSLMGDNVGDQQRDEAEMMLQISDWSLQMRRFRVRTSLETGIGCTT